MQIENQSNEKKITYPAECTFKAVFRNREDTGNLITCILEGNNIKGRITQKESSNGKFISYTVIAEFPNEEILQDICRSISKLQGYMTLF